MGRNFDPASGPAADGSRFFPALSLRSETAYWPFLSGVFRGENRLFVGSDSPGGGSDFFSFDVSFCQRGL